MAKSQVQISYDLSSEEGEDIKSDTNDSHEEEDGDGNIDSEVVEEVEEEEVESREGGTSSDDQDDDEEDDAEEGDGEDDDGEEADGEDDDQNDEDTTEQKSGLADVMAKILRKQAPDNKPVILSKALTDKQVRLKRKIKEAQETGDIQQKKSRDDSSSDEDYGLLSKEQLLKRKAWEALGRRKVDITQREPEKQLQRVATKGVLQLFNAVAKQQKLIEERLREVGSSERKKDDVMKSMSKGAFLDMLKTTPNVNDEPVESKEKVIKKRRPTEDDTDSDEEEDKKGKPSWNILRDDFMMGAKMKDWDQEDDDSDEPTNDIGDDSSGNDS